MLKVDCTWPTCAHLVKKTKTEEILREAHPATNLALLILIGCKVLLEVGSPGRLSVREIVPTENANCIFIGSSGYPDQILVHYRPKIKYRFISDYI